MEPLALDTLLHYIAANIRNVRKRRSITQESLAEEAGLGLRYLQSIERAQKPLSLASLVSIANALEVAPGMLLRPATMPEVTRGRPRKARPT